MGTLIVNQYLSKLWTPAEMTTTLWLDAADSSTITTVSGTVSEWEDKKNNGLILTTLRRPLYNASLNNLNVISFVRNSQHYLRTTSFPSTGWSNLLVFVVTKWTGIGSNSTADIQSIIDNDHSGSPGKGFIFQDRPDLNGDPLTYSRLPNSININGVQDNTNPGDNTWKMYCGYSSSIFDRLYRDGEVVGELANTDAFNFTNTLNVGRWELGRYLQGDIAEIVISQDTTAIDKVFGYLAHKWGLTANLPVAHPYKTTPPYV